MLADSLSYANGFYLSNSTSTETILIAKLANTLARLFSVNGSGIFILALKTFLLKRISRYNPDSFKYIYIIYVLPGTLLFTSYVNKDSILLIFLTMAFLLKKGIMKNILIMFSIFMKPFVILISANRVNNYFKIFFAVAIVSLSVYALKIGLIKELFTYLELHLKNDGNSTYNVNILQLSAPKLILYILEIVCFGVPLSFIEINGTVVLVLIQQLSFFALIFILLKKGLQFIATFAKYLSSATILLAPFLLFNAGAALRYSIIYFMVFFIMTYNEHSHSNK